MFLRAQLRFYLPKQLSLAKVDFTTRLQSFSCFFVGGQAAARAGEKNDKFANWRRCLGCSSSSCAHANVKAPLEHEASPLPTNGADAGLRFLLAPAALGVKPPTSAQPKTNNGHLSSAELPAAKVGAWRGASPRMRNVVVLVLLRSCN